MPKALVEVNGQLLVERGVAGLRAAGCAPCTVVLGWAAPRVRARADLSGAEVVVAGDWDRGQSASVRAGLRSLGRMASGGAAVPAVVITLVDQPLVGAQAVRRLVDAWVGGAAVAVGCVGGRLGNPVLLDRAVWGEVDAALTGDRGAGPWLRRHPERVTRVEIGDVADLMDIDTPQDLEEVRRRLGRAP